MGLIDDDGVVLIEEAVPLHLGEQNAVCHKLDGGGFRDAVIETNGVADGLSDFLVQFRGDAFSHSAGSNAARLGVPDESAASAAQIQTDFWDLSGLTRTGLTGDDDDLVISNGRGDIVLAVRDGEGVGIGDGGNGGVGKCDELGRSVDLGAYLLQRLWSPGFFQAAAEGPGFREGDIVECSEKFIAGRGFIHSHD